GVLAMDRARAAHLISGGLAGDEADQAEDFSHGHPGPDFSEANTRHGGGPQDPGGGRRGPKGRYPESGREAQRVLSANSASFPGADGGPVTRGLSARHRAFSSFNQISASMRRNRTS